MPNELFREFFKLIGVLNENDLSYAVVGGIAMAFHATPRFTKDIDILGIPTELDRYRAAFESVGYRERTKPWTFKNTNITLHRFTKLSEEADGELLMIDLLIGNEDHHASIISNSITDDSAVGKVRVARREDLIAMKKWRGSKQDEADIENLEKGIADDKD